jgi:hypothetical protein
MAMYGDAFDRLDIADAALIELAKDVWEAVDGSWVGVGGESFGRGLYSNH